MSEEAPYLGQNCQTPDPRRVVLLRWLWALVQATLFRWSPRPLHGFRARLLKLFGADIPEPGQVVVFPTVRITYPWRLTLEPRAMIGRHVIVYNLGHITLRRGTHDFMRWDMPLLTPPIEIGPNAWIGADVFVGPGVTVGELCVVGARSVVVHDLPAHTICVGQPCRPIKPRETPRRA